MARLVAATSIRYGRLVDCSVRLDEKVIAIVGPNEAGKTTLLKSLSYATGDSSMADGNRPRGLGETESPLVELRFCLDQEDIDELTERFALNQCPKQIAVTKLADGSKKHTLSPQPMRNAKLHKYLRDLLESDQLDDEAIRQLKIVVDCYDSGECLTPSKYEHLERQLIEHGYEKHAECLRRVIAALDKDLEDSVCSRVIGRLPCCVIFGDDSRDLRGEYDITDEVASNPPVALQNLLKLANIDIRELREAIKRGDDIADTVIDKGNMKLQERFEASWDQSPVIPRMKMVGSKLSLQFREPTGNITRFDSRSTGLRTFVSLLAFLYANGMDANTVLLIDEAENHLHVDAQVNLIDTFLSQSLVGKIIYTTHSPACLPPDLGNAIKAVVPDPDNDFKSIVTGNLMELNPGGVFPLSLAMGAMTAAMSAYKAAVIVEGASDAILLPTLIKQVVGCADLPYRIVPGLAQTKPTMFDEYEMLAAKVVYVVDGDKDGACYAEELSAHGVAASRIIHLDKGMILEDLVSFKTYANAFRKFAIESATSSKSFTPIPESPAELGKCVEVMEQWCKDNKVQVPSKPAIAYRLLDGIDAKDLPSVSKKILRKIDDAARRQTDRES